jgi:hypothetical protein
VTVVRLALYLSHVGSDLEADIITSVQPDEAPVIVIFRWHVRRSVRSVAASRERSIRDNHEAVAHAYVHENC